MAARVVAEAGSQPILSAPMMALASAMSCSSTEVTQPSLQSTARRAFFQLTGAPILIAVARVRAWCTRSSISGCPLLPLLKALLLKAL